MAKLDWGELQQRFLSDNAETGVSSKEWCEAQGLNYATTRGYIKNPAAQNVQKSAQKKVRTGQKEKSTDALVDSELTAQQKRFVAEYLIDQNVRLLPQGQITAMRVIAVSSSRCAGFAAAESISCALARHGR